MNQKCNRNCTFDLEDYNTDKVDYRRKILPITKGYLTFGMKHGTMTMREVSRRVGIDMDYYRKAGSESEWSSIMSGRVISIHRKDVLESIHRQLIVDWQYGYGNRFKPRIVVSLSEFLDRQWGIGKYNEGFFPNEGHTHQHYRLAQLSWKNKSNIFFVSLSELDSIISDTWQIQVHENSGVSHDDINNLYDDTWSHYNDALTKEHNEWYDLQTEANELPISRWLDI